MSEDTPNTTLEELARAMEEADGRTPADIIDAFCPDRREVAGLSLVKLTAGHELLWSKLDHPFARGVGDWTPNDLALALFTCTRTSAESFRLLEEGAFENTFYQFLDDIPVDELGDATSILIAHWLESRKPSLAMKPPAGSNAGKKKAASVGG